MKTNNNYLKKISEVWAIKEKIYQETKEMDFKQYTEYLDMSIKELKVRFSSKKTGTAKISISNLHDPTAVEV
jgi:hypothetical protein